jgi:hypothetical protein
MHVGLHVQRVNSRVYNASKNVNAGISVFLIGEIGIPVLMPVFQTQTFFSINFDDSFVQLRNGKSNYLNSCFKSNRILNILTKKY